MSENTAVVLDNTTATKVKSKAGRPVDPNSKAAHCKTLFVKLANEGKNRAEILAAFVSAFPEKPITRGTAQVYYHEAQNAAKAAGLNLKVQRSPSTPRQPKVVAPVAADASVDVTG